MAAVATWSADKVFPRLRSSALLHDDQPVEWREEIRQTIEIICTVLERDWGKFANLKEWSSFLNCSRIAKEIEEAVVPIAYVLQILRKSGTEWTVLDLCSGKGFFACLLCDVVANDKRLKPLQMKRVVMVDNDDNINWEHVKLLNEFHQGQGVPYAPIDAHRACLYSDEFSACLRGILNSPTGECSPQNIFVIGTHLCRRLSAHAVEVYNELVHATPKDAKCALLLAPCCLPVFRGFCYIKGRCNREEPKTGEMSPKPPAPLPGLTFLSDGETALYAQVCWHMLQAQEAGKGGIKLSDISKVCKATCKMIKRVAYKGRRAGELKSEHGMWSLREWDDKNGKFARMKAGNAVFEEEGKGADEGSGKVLTEKFCSWTCAKDVPNFLSERGGRRCSILKTKEDSQTFFKIDLFSLGLVSNGQPFLYWVSALAAAVERGEEGTTVRLVQAPLVSGAHTEQEKNGNCQSERRSSWILAW